MAEVKKITFSSAIRVFKKKKRVSYSRFCRKHNTPLFSLSDAVLQSLALSLQSACITAHHISRLLLSEFKFQT